MNLLRSSLAASLIAAAGLSVIPVSPVQAAGEQLGGTAIPGLCMLSREAVFAQSKVGQAASDRLNMLAQQARSQLDAQRKPLDTDIQSFQQKAPSLSETVRNQQGAALQQRMQTFKTEADEQNERIQLTREKVLQQIGKDAQPFIDSSYKSHRCGLLLNRDSVFGGNTTNDLTKDVVDGLDRTITAINFGLEPLPSKDAAGNSAVK